jgi:hypothetical protein
MALALVARLTDEPTARMVQFWIEYDPQPPFGGIDWGQVDRDMAEPVVAQWVQTQLADRPELLAKGACEPANREPAAAPPKEADKMSSRHEPQPTAKSIEYSTEQLQLAGASGRGGLPPCWPLLSPRRSASRCGRQPARRHRR